MMVHIWNKAVLAVVFHRRIYSTHITPKDGAHLICEKDGRGKRHRKFIEYRKKESSKYLAYNPGICGTWS